MRRSYKYRAVITKETEFNCYTWLDLCRNLYNYTLQLKIDNYKETKKYVSYFDQAKTLPEFKKLNFECKQVDAQAFRNTIERLDNAFKAFFRRVKTGETPGFPRFKSQARYNSFTLMQNSWKLEGKYLYVRNLGKFKLKLSRPVEGVIKTITIKKAPTGKWFVTFSCDEVPSKEFKPTTSEVGIDVGITSFLTDSENNIVENPRYFGGSARLLRRRQRSLSRKQKGSHRRYKSKLLVAKAHEKIVNQRNDFLHKLSTQYIQQYNKIYIEDLQISNMVRSKYYAKSISDVGWGRFFEFLAYKAEEASRQVFKVNPKNTSQLCSTCGTLVTKSMAVRVHKCSNCGLVMDRDLNAAINIKKLGQSFQEPTLELSGVS